MTTFFTADTHFNHNNIRVFCNRPFATMEEMDAKLIENWNNKITKKDEVYILGDFAWKNHCHFIMALNGKKHLILGNHDKASSIVYKNFTSVNQILQKAFDKTLVIMCHFPMRSWNGRVHGSWHLFGHVHGRLNNDLYPRTYDVGIDNNNYTPIEWTELKNIIINREDYKNYNVYKHRKIDENLKNGELTFIEKELVL